jgi:hypothetical protein
MVDYNKKPPQGKPDDSDDQGGLKNTDLLRGQRSVSVDFQLHFLAKMSIINVVEGLWKNRKQ